MASKNITMGNINIFEDLNINQLGLKKNDTYFKEYLTF